MKFNMKTLKVVGEKVGATAFQFVDSNDRQRHFDYLGLHITTKFEDILGTTDVEIKVYLNSTLITQYLWTSKVDMRTNEEKLSQQFFEQLSRYILERLMDNMDLEAKLTDMIENCPKRVDLFLGYYFDSHHLSNRGVAVAFGDEEGSLTSGPVRTAQEAVPFMISALKYRIPSMYCLHNGKDFEVDLEWL